MMRASVVPSWRRFRAMLAICLAPDTTKKQLED